MKLKRQTLKTLGVFFCNKPIKLVLYVLILIIYVLNSSSKPSDGDIVTVVIFVVYITLSYSLAVNFIFVPIGEAEDISWLKNPNESAIVWCVSLLYSINTLEFGVNIFCTCYIYSWC